MNLEIPFSAKTGTTNITRYIGHGAYLTNVSRATFKLINCIDQYCVTLSMNYIQVNMVRTYSIKPRCGEAMVTKITIQFISDRGNCQKSPDKTTVKFPKYTGLFLTFLHMNSTWLKILMLTHR